MNKQNTVNILVIHAANMCTWNMNWKKYFLIIFSYHCIIISLFFFQIDLQYTFFGGFIKNVSFKLDYNSADFV